MTLANEITNYRDFWPFYLREHARPLTRTIHIIGTWLAVALVCTAAITADFRLLALAALAGYGLAWAAHFAVEKNRPATFRYPFWSLISDFRMAGLWLLGRLPEELKRAGVPVKPG